MRRAIELAINRFVRSRYGVATLLAVVVLGVLGSVRLVAQPDEPPPLTRAVVDRPLTTVDPGAGDDGLVTIRPPASPKTSPGAAKPLAVARSFATAWLRHEGVTSTQWHAALRPYCTDDFAGLLVGADPAEVPADRITGELELIPHGSTFVEVAVPVDSGRLVLQLVAPDGRWLVDGVNGEQP